MTGDDLQSDDDRQPQEEPEIGDRWGQFPTSARCAELDARLIEWEATPEHTTSRSPFDRKVWQGAKTTIIHNDEKYVTDKPLTGADVFYLACRAIVGLQKDPSGVAKDLRSGEIFEFDLHLEGADLAHANLDGAYLYEAHLVDARLTQAQIRGADLGSAHLEGANLYEAQLQGTYLAEAYFDLATDLSEIRITDKLHGAAKLADVRWQGTNLAVVSWPERVRLGEETEAAQREDKRRYRLFTSLGRFILDDYRTAARTYRQVAAAMRDQGMNDEADRFAYRGQLMQRKVFLYQRKVFRAALSWFFDLIAGYGYKPERSLIAYVGVILSFAAAYFVIGQTAGPALSPLGAFVFSMTSFHGRGFFPGGITLDDPLTVVAAFEALFGLIIEVSFIATFTQRFFGK